jgi:hypothetical protein
MSAAIDKLDKTEPGKNGLIEVYEQPRLLRLARG